MAQKTLSIPFEDFKKLKCVQQDLNNKHLSSRWGDVINKMYESYLIVKASEEEI